MQPTKTEQPTSSPEKTARTAPSSPTAAQMLEKVLELGREVHLEMREGELIERFLDTLEQLFPDRSLAIRVFDPRSVEAAKLHVRRGELRAGVDRDRITLKRSSIEKTRLKTAIAESARLKIGDRWDSPFVGVASGLAVPLVASGELYGVLDVGYPLGVDLAEVDEPLVIPIVNHLSVALRNERLHRETTLLRDYQAKLIEHADALILGVDRHWRVTVCNQALCRISGFEREQMIGRDVRDWLRGQDRARLTKLFLQALAGRRTDPVDVALVTRSGKLVRTVWSVAGISGRGTAQAVVAIGQDQTKLRELQNQVIQAEKLATLGQLAAGVVHELNNPLTSITVYAEYLLKKAESRGDVGPIAEDDGDIEKLRRISAGAHRILQFAKDLVQYAKPAGYDSDVVALNKVVEQSLSFCEHLFDGREVTLEVELADELPAIYAVPGQLEQVVINLITNAVHACGASGRVAVRSFSPAPGMAAISVLDSGAGVPEPDRERIFEPFFTTKTDGEGTGLGLSIVRNIVEQHRGTIRVDDADKGGARFTIELPAHDGDGI